MKIFLLMLRIEDNELDFHLLDSVRRDLVLIIADKYSRVSDALQIL